MHVGRVLRGEQRNHRAGGFADDLRDQLERMFRGEAEPDECDIRSLSSGDRPDFLHVDLTGDHLVPEPGHDLGEQLEPVAPLVCNQDAKVPGLVSRHLKWSDFSPAPPSGNPGTANPQRPIARASDTRTPRYSQRPRYRIEPAPFAVTLRVGRSRDSCSSGGFRLSLRTRGRRSARRRRRRRAAFPSPGR